MHKGRVGTVWKATAECARCAIFAALGAVCTRDSSGFEYHPLGLANDTLSDRIASGQLGLLLAAPLDGAEHVGESRRNLFSLACAKGQETGNDARACWTLVGET